MLTSGCVHSTRVQMDYIAKRDECRGIAERNQQFYTGENAGRSNSPVLSAKDNAAILAKIFADCMYVNGWTVATPRQQARPGEQKPRPGERQVASREDDLEFLSTPSSTTPTTTQRASVSRQPQTGQTQSGSANNVYIPSASVATTEQRKPVNVPRR